MNIYRNVSRILNVDTKVTRSHTPLFGDRFPVIKISNSDSDSLTKRDQSLLHSSIDEKVLKTNIIFLIEVLIKSSYNINKEFSVFDPSYLDVSYLNTAIEFFSTKSTFPTAITRETTLS